MSHDRETEPLRHRRLPPRDAEAVLAPGTDIASWRVVRHIATGGCGAVYEVVHRVLDRPAAVKVLSADLAGSPSMVARFVLEAKAVNMIRHPGIVDVFDIGELADGRPFMAMELLDEDSLDDRLVADGRWRVEDVLSLFGPLCDAVTAAHAHGIIHRDIKGRNVGFTVDDAGGRPKLLDFGIAKLLEPTEPGQSSPTQRVGTPQSMSPEQIRGDRVDARTDVYGLGVLLFHVLTGRYPFVADDSLEVERMHLEVPPPRPSDVLPLPAAIDRLVTRAMAKDPADRPATVPAFVDELRAALGQAPAVRSEPAVAVRIELDLSRVDDAVLDVAAARQAEVAAQLVANGFTITLATSTATHAVRALTGVAADRAMTEGRALVVALARALAEHRDPVPGATVLTSVELIGGTT
ncbi:MAG TPA: serine/threonine-protein kinase [Kofleriaceae bacterium]|nr:serine/threonine-protein kinase [Kofleriaceae bacterium]